MAVQNRPRFPALIRDPMIFKHTKKEKEEEGKKSGQKPLWKLEGQLTKATSRWR